MTKKETTSIQDLMTVIKILEESSIAYWIDGGWGVDILAGKQTRPHRDIDVDFDAQYTEKLLAILTEHGYQVKSWDIWTYTHLFYMKMELQNRLI